MLKNKYIDLKDIEDDININNFDNNIILGNSTELSVSESSSSITELSMKNSTFLVRVKEKLFQLFESIYIKSMMI